MKYIHKSLLIAAVFGLVLLVVSVLYKFKIQKLPTWLSFELSTWTAEVDLIGLQVWGQIKTGGPKILLAVGNKIPSLSYQDCHALEKAQLLKLSPKSYLGPTLY